MLMPAAVSSPSPDPGVVWAMFTGLALGLRSAPHRVVAGRPRQSRNSHPLREALSIP
jgi:hypothetical protein